MNSKKEIKKAVKKHYGKIAQTTTSCGCCSPKETFEKISKGIGYSENELKELPEGSDLGLGCGNPTAMALLKSGETVLDLGSGAGIDCFLAARKVGPKGKVIGVDMTDEMLKSARENALKGNYKNIEFRKGEIENLPIEDNTIDIIISNCVINLSPDKPQVFKEVFRVLKPGGRLMISDIVLLKELKPEIKKDIEYYVSCVSGASLKNQYIDIIRKTGFENIKILKEETFSLDFIVDECTNAPLSQTINLDKKKVKEIQETILSINISAQKPN